MNKFCSASSGTKEQDPTQGTQLLSLQNGLPWGGSRVRANGKATKLSIFELLFSWFSIYLVAVSLWLFSGVLTKLVLTVSAWFFFFGVSVGEHELTAYPLHQFADIPPQLHCWEWLFLLLPSSGPGTWVILTKSTLTKSLNWCMTSAYCRVSLKGHGKQSRNKFNLVNVPTGHTFYPFAVVNTVQQCLHHSGRVAKVSPHLQLIVKGYFLKCCAEW